MYICKISKFVKHFKNLVFLQQSTSIRLLKFLRYSILITGAKNQKRRLIARSISYIRFIYEKSWYLGFSRYITCFDIFEIQLNSLKSSTSIDTNTSVLFHQKKIDWAGLSRTLWPSTVSFLHAIIEEKFGSFYQMEEVLYRLWRN